MKKQLLVLAILTLLFSCEYIPQIDICQHEVIEAEIIGEVTYMESENSRVSVEVISYWNELPETVGCEEAVICPVCGKIMDVNRISLIDKEHIFEEY